MNERIKALKDLAVPNVDWEARFYTEFTGGDRQRFENEWFENFAKLMVNECVGILEAEIELVRGYKETVHNDNDRRWHDGKIAHFTKLVAESKKHFGITNE